MFKIKIRWIKYWPQFIYQKSPTSSPKSFRAPSTVISLCWSEKDFGVPVHLHVQMMNWWKRPNEMAFDLVEEQVYPCMAAIVCSGLPSSPVSWTFILANLFYNSTKCKSVLEGEKEVEWSGDSLIGKGYVILFQILYERRFANKKKKVKVDKSEEKVLKQQWGKMSKAILWGRCRYCESCSQSEEANMVS